MLPNAFLRAVRRHFKRRREDHEYPPSDADGSITLAEVTQFDKFSANDMGLVFALMLLQAIRDDASELVFCYERGVVYSRAGESEREYAPPPTLMYSDLIRYIAAGTGLCSRTEGSFWIPGPQGRITLTVKDRYEPEPHLIVTGFPTRRRRG